MINDTPAIQSLHRAYEQLTGLSIPLSFDKMHLWRIYLERGFTESDLRLTVATIRRKVNKVTATRIFRFSRFIGNIEQMAEDIAEARALSRSYEAMQKQRSEKAKVLAMISRPAPIKQTAQSAAAILAGNSALAQLLKLRDSL